MSARAAGISYEQLCVTLLSSASLDSTAPLLAGKLALPG